MKSHLKIAIFASMLFAGFSTVAQTDTSKAVWLTHKDAEYNLSIEYPSDWTLKPPSASARFFITSRAESPSDNFKENLNCIVPSDVSAGSTIQQQEEDITKTLSESLDNYKLVQSNYSKWNNVNAFEIEYTCSQTSDGTTYNLHILQKVAIIKGKLYALTYTSLVDSYDRFIGAIRKMIRSFRVM